MLASAASRSYPCSDGEIEIDIQTADGWRALAVCLGRPELAYDGAWDAVKRAAPDGPVARVVAQMFAEDSAASWMRRLDAHGVPCRLL
jgi:crotonobetainyl-CoA:carnitine CoA-transferase CaiB-like acyl-CoA transferase